MVHVRCDPDPGGNLFRAPHWNARKHARGREGEFGRRGSRLGPRVPGRRSHSERLAEPTQRRGRGPPVTADPCARRGMPWPSRGRGGPPPGKASLPQPKEDAMTPRRILLPLLAGLLGFLFASGLAAAHAQYVSSTPAAGAILPTAPTNVSVTLSETIQSGTGTMRVTNESGVRFDVPPVTYAPDGRALSISLGLGGPGIYTVTWTAVSAVDGHFTAGSFSYGVQDKNGNVNGTVPGLSSTGAPISPLEVALRSIGFLGLAIALGIGVMANFMWLPAGRDPDARGARAYGLAFPILLNVSRIAAFAFAASMVGLFALATGLEGGLAAQGLLNSAYVQSVAVRVAIGVGLFVLFSRAFARSRTESPEKSAWTIQATIVLSLAAVVAASLGTHAAAVPVIAGIGVAADAAHFGGIGLWVGGLAGIVAIRNFLRQP
ncbi:MAG: hypothetical protein E6K12_01945, partial [Methanobacteriota archaeon]